MPCEEAGIIPFLEYEPKLTVYRFDDDDEFLHPNLNIKNEITSFPNVSLQIYIN